MEQSTSVHKKQMLEQATREFLKKAKSGEVEIRRHDRREATAWHKSLPTDRRQQINEAYRVARLSGLTRLSFADWLIEKFAD